MLAAAAAHIGWETTVAHLERVGWGMLSLCGIHVVTLTCDSLSLRLAVGRGLSFPRAVGIAVSGAAINSLAPFGEAGEPVKVGLASRVIPVPQATAGIVVWNLIYRLTKWSLVFISPALVWTCSQGTFSGLAVAGMLAASLILFAPTLGLLLAVRAGPGRLVVRFLRSLPLVGGRRWDAWDATAQGTDAAIAEFAATRRGDALKMAGLLTLARLSATAEIWAVMWMLGLPVDFPTALFVFTGGALVKVLLTISPVQLGAIEAGAGAMFHLIGLPVEVGFAQAFVRRLRMLLFNAVGVALIPVLGRRTRPPGS